MENIYSQQLLSDPEQKPTDRLFKRILDRRTYELMRMIDQNSVAAGLTLEWRYYKDGKAWLGKLLYKKKNLVWLSVWEKFIRAGFYFTEKTRPGVMELDFNEAIKSSFVFAKPVGKLFPLIVDIENEERMKDFAIILEYKKNLR